MNATVEDRAYQEEAIENSLAELQEADRAQIHMACATGKSYVQAKTLKAFLERRAPEEDDPPIIHCFVPNLGLVRQMEKSFRTILGDDIEYLGVGTNKERKEEALKQGYLMKMSTSETKINAAINGRKKPIVVFSTYQSSRTLAEAMVNEDGSKMRAALMLMDEAHRTAGEKSRTSPFAYPLHDVNIAADKRLFYTATPNTVEFGEDGKEELHSMDNEALYGKAVFDYPYSRALKDGVVAPFRIQAPIITKDEIRAYRELKNLSDSDDRAIIAELALNKVMEQTGQDKILTFHNSIESSKQFAGRLTNALGPNGFHVEHIDGSSSASERGAAFDKMAQGPTVITSVRAIGEGADSPGIQALLFADPRSSVREVIQNIGRVQRKDKNNPDKIGSIICPIIIDEHSKQSPEEQILNSDYKTIFQVTEALRASNNVAAVATKEASRNFGRTGELPEEDTAGIEILGNNILSPERMAELQRAIRLTTFNHMVDHFQVNLGKMETFIAEHGRVPEIDDRDKDRLGLWYSQVKEEAEKGLLSRDEREAVESIQRTEDELAKNSNSQNLHRLERLGDEIDIIDDVDRTQFPHLDTWLDKIRTEHANGTLPLDDIERCEALPFFTWCDEDTPLDIAAQHRDRFMERHGMPPTNDCKIAGISEASIVIPFELAAEREADEAARRAAEEHEKLLEDPEIHLRHIRGEATPEEQAVLAQQESLRFPEGVSREDATFQALEVFWEEHNCPPTALGEIAGRTEELLAAELAEAERAYIEAYFESDTPPSDDEAPFDRLLPTQKQIAESRAFMQEPGKDENLVRGQFQPARNGKGWEFIARPIEGTGAKLFNTGWEVPSAAIRMDLSRAQEDQVKALGPKHMVTIDLQRAGKNHEPHKDGALGRIKSGWSDRDDASFFNFMVARFKDRAAQGKPAYTMQNALDGKFDLKEPITNLTPKEKREGKKFLKTSALAFIKNTDMLREHAFEGKHSPSMTKRLSACPGFSWYEHSDSAKGFEETVKFFAERGGPKVLGNTKAREGDNGLANTLRELDKTVMAYRKAEQVPPAVSKVMAQYKEEYRAITLAARAIEDRKAEDAAKQNATLAKSSRKSEQGNAGQEELT